jgi:hypothetical protein
MAKENKANVLMECAVVNKRKPLTRVMALEFGINKNAIMGIVMIKVLSVLQEIVVCQDIIEKRVNINLLQVNAIHLATYDYRL